MIVMIKKIIILALLSFGFLAACSSKYMDFIGENNNWKVNYQVSAIDGDSESTTLTIQYIGKEPIPKEIKYTIESLTGKLEGEDSLNKGVLKTNGHFCKGCSVTQENEKIKATIMWNGKTESINLKNQ